MSEGGCCGFVTRICNGIKQAREQQAQMQATMSRVPKNLKALKAETPAVDVPEGGLPVALRAWLESDSTSLAIVETCGASISRAELWTRIRAVSSRLRKVGLHSGDVVSIALPNGIDFVSVFFGILAAGGVPLVLDSSLTGSTMAGHMLTNTAEFAVSTSACAKHMIDAIECVQDCHGITCREHWWTGDIGHVREVAKGVMLSTLECTEITDLYTDDGQAYPIALRPKGKDPAVLFLTSGSQGRPKACRLSQDAVVSQVESLRKSPEVLGHIGAGDVVGTCLSLSNVYGFAAVVAATLAQGGQLLLAPTGQVKELFQAVPKYNATVVHVSPSQFQEVVATGKPIACVKDVFLYGARAPLKMTPAVSDVFPSAEVRQAYGLTEAGGVTHVTPKGAAGKGIGKALPGVGAQVVALDGSSQKAGPKIRGELVVKTPGIFPGYINDVQGTMEVLDDKGFLHTGDLAYATEAGEIVVVGRVKDLVHCKGQLLEPEPVEKMLCEMGMTAAAVVGKEMEGTAGQVPVAFVVPTAGINGTSAEEVKERVNSRIDPERGLADVIVVQKISLTSKGDVDRAFYRKQLED